MTCYGPVTAYYAAAINSNGKRSLVFDKRKAHSGIALKVPCGRCHGCRLDRSSRWALRCMHERRLHKQSSFLTLTYNNQNLPADGTLLKRDLQLFMKRLRKADSMPVVMVDGININSIRFFACGEYGDENNRPHYHVLLFNRDFDDRKFYKKSKAGENLYTSKKVEELWPIGFNTVGDVSYESCAYVARYVLKKMQGPKADDHYAGREQEFVLMSRRPGIGSAWFDKYHEQAYAHDNTVVDGREMPLPRYYDDKYEKIQAAHLFYLKLIRRKRALERRADSTRARLRVRETVAIAKSRIYKRNLE
ncbi:replication initiator protein [Blackfly microvirus SF02]|uniref:Replication initiator protein n=1 Tax=Blackfly microvirus SF02 TaxID=2576452 RepID=A0A4P8PSN5_9VIRU|nr:replication initiator protein [Blackfly microvirus SF02]